MGECDDNKQAPLVPSWQQAASNQTDDPAASPASTLDQARRFLQEEAVQDASREKKVEFLKSKGIEESIINSLLEESTEPPPPAIAQPIPSQPTTTTPPVVESLESASSSPPESSASKPDHPPIVTYPEFLTKPLKPPPLITASGLLNTLTGIAAASTLIYGATKHLVSPMVTTLTAARVDLHAAANANLTTLVTTLERAVSELPAGYHTLPNKPGATGAITDVDTASASSYDDPSELFHRDVGVQTSAPPSPVLPTTTAANPSWYPTTASSSGAPRLNPTAHQASRLAQLATNVRAITADQTRQVEALQATKGELEAFGTDLHALTYPPASGFGVGSNYLYGAAANKNEPDDEIRRVKTSIRGVKGMLLSTRSFPATTR